MRPFFYAFLLIMATFNVMAEVDASNHLKLMGRHIVVASDARLGGLSGIRLSADGKHLFAIIDEGRFAQAELNWDGGELVSVDNWRIGDLEDRNGEAFIGKNGDAESIEFADDDEFYVSFERKHRISLMRSDGDSLREQEEIPVTMLEANSNKGIEAIVRLKNNNLLAFAEEFEPADNLPQDGYKAAYLWDGKKWQNKAYEISGGFSPTDAVMLPDGDILVLERLFDLDGRFYSRIKKIKAADVASEVIKPELVAEISSECGYDNMEGLAAWQGEDGKTRLVVVSDDNFRLWQKTYVVAFEYEQ